MTLPQGDNWIPSRELLAAYADGELDQRPHLANVRHKIEHWLASHPEAAAELEAQMALGRVWAATTPVEPAPAQWAKVWQRVQRVPGPRKLPRWPAALWLAGVAAVGAAAAVLFVLLVQPPAAPDNPQTPSPQAGEAHQRRNKQATVPAASAGADNDAQEQDAVPTSFGPARPGRRHRETFDVLEVATADEIEIVRIAGADTGTLVVGQPPLVGTMILLTPREVEVKTPVNDDAGMEVRMGGSSAIVWPRSRNEDDK
jgi:hypothetical protein